MFVCACVFVNAIFHLFQGNMDKNYVTVVACIYTFKSATNFIQSSKLLSMRKQEIHILCKSHIESLALKPPVIFIFQHQHSFAGLA